MVYLAWTNKKRLSRFDSIINQTKNGKTKSRLIKLKNYLIDNKDYLINYAKHYNSRKVISSSIAESNIENLINKSQYVLNAITQHAA